MVDVEKLLSSLKLAPYVFAGLAIASAIVLFAPPNLQAQLGLDALLVGYRTWVGLTLIVSSSICLTSLGAKLSHLFGPALLEAWNTRQYRKGLRLLSDAERKVLAQYLLDDTMTQPQHASDGVVGGLIARRILYRSSNIGRPGSMSFDTNLQPWAWTELHKRPHLVGLPKEWHRVPSRGVIVGDGPDPVHDR